MNVWADHVQTTPGTVCEDAAQTEANWGRGQVGWDIGLHFRDLAHLADRLANYEIPEDLHIGELRRIPPGSVRRLAISCHGLAGRFFCDDRPVPSGANPPDIGLTANRFEYYRSAVAAVGRFLDPAGTVFLMGCLAGQGPDGTRLLNRLSGPDGWPGRTVVGFITLGRIGDQSRPTANCTEPGMRLTDETSPSLTGRQPIAEQRGLAQYDWADENHPFAKVSVNGGIVRGDDAEDPTMWFGWNVRPGRLPGYVPRPRPGDVDTFGRPTGEYLRTWHRELRAAGVIPPLDPPGTPLVWPFGHRPAHRHHPRGPLVY